MGDRICSFPGCGKGVLGLDLCSGHYNQQHRGRPLTPIRPTLSTEERFFAKVAQDGDCWRWIGAIGRHGYGNFLAEGQYLRAHCWAYEHLRADIPDGLVIDHLCRNQWCVNPWHLEPVTQAVNVQRGDSAEARRAQCAAIRRCRNGHEFIPENTYVDKRGWRSCVTCRRSAQARYVARQQSA